MPTSAVRLVVLFSAAVLAGGGCTRSNPLGEEGGGSGGGGGGGAGGGGAGGGPRAVDGGLGDDPVDLAVGGDLAGSPGDTDGGPPPPPPPPIHCSGKSAQPLNSTWTLHVGGVDRRVQAHVPAAYDVTKPTSLILNFHGYTSNGGQQAAVSGMSSRSDKAGYVVLYPEGTGNPSGFNGGGCCGMAASRMVDDIGFTRAIIDEAKSRLCIDDKRVFAAGFSNGGFMSQRIACELGDRVAAIAAVSAPLALPAGETCKPARPIPVLTFHGTSDNTVPYPGDSGSGWPSATTSFAGWAMRDGCTDAAPAQTYQKGDVTCLTYQHCGGGAEVTLCTVQGGGHAWPGSVIPLPGTTQNINASDTMWAFFEAHPLP
jgi:polyhydroxybutyrate depolymerase